MRYFVLKKCRSRSLCEVYGLSVWSGSALEEGAEEFEDGRVNVKQKGWQKQSSPTLDKACFSKTCCPARKTCCPARKQHLRGLLGGTCQLIDPIVLYSSHFIEL